MVNAPLVSRPPNPPRSRFAAGLVSAIKWNPHALPAADAIGAQPSQWFAPCLTHSVTSPLPGFIL